MYSKPKPQGVIIAHCQTQQTRDIEPVLRQRRSISAFLVSSSNQRECQILILGDS